MEEDAQDKSENDMSFVLTGPLNIVPFPRSPKRDFTEFSSDYSFRPPERELRSAYSGNVQQLSTSNTYYSDTRERGLQLPDWMRWSIYRTLELVQYTAYVLQTFYAATVVVAMPFAAAKRRIASLSRDMPTPAPLRRLLSSRRTSRIFRQSSSASPGRPSTTPITPPRFRNSPPSPYHLPGQFPFSPVRSPHNLPAILGKAVEDAAIAPTGGPSNGNGSPAKCGIVDTTTLQDEPPKASSNLLVTPRIDAYGNSSHSPMNEVTDDTFSLGHRGVDEMSSPDNYMSDIMPEPEPLPTLSWTEVPLTSHQIASIDELEAIQIDYQARMASLNQLSGSYITPEALTAPTEGISSQVDESIESNRSSLAHESGTLSLEKDGSIELLRSPSATLEQPIFISPIISDLTPSPTTQENEERHSRSKEMAGQTQDLSEHPKIQSLLSAGLIDIARSPAVENNEQQTSHVVALNDFPQAPCAQEVQEQPSASRGLIESTRSPVAEETVQYSSASPGSIESTRSPVAEETVQYSSAFPGSIGSTRFPVAEETAQYPSGSSGLIKSIRSPTAEETAQQPSSSTESFNSTPAPCAQKIGQHSASNGLIDSARSSVDISRQQSQINDGSNDLMQSPSVKVPLQRAVTTILKRSSHKPSNKGLMRKLFSSINGGNSRNSPLGIALNSANAMTTRIQKSARFSPNPITRTKKYVKGEAISYPSPISSRDENSILSSPPQGSSYLSPTKEEQQAMINSQLMNLTPPTDVRELTAEIPARHMGEHSPVTCNGVTRTSYSDSSDRNGLHQAAIEQTPIESQEAPGNLDTGSSCQEGSYRNTPALNPAANSEASGTPKSDSKYAQTPRQSPSVHSSTIGSEISGTLVSDAVCPQATAQRTPVRGHDQSVFAQEFTQDSPTRSPVTENQDPEKTQSRSNGEAELNKASPTADHNNSQRNLTPGEMRNSDPTTPQNKLSSQLAGLSVSVRRSSRRTQKQEQREEALRCEQEAIAAEEQARRERQEAEEKALQAKVEADEKARKEKAEAEEKARKEAEDEERLKKSRLRMPIERVIQPLTAEWEQRVNAALALAPTKVIGHTSRGTPITRREIGRVLPQYGTGDPPSGWLNDSIIDAYLQAIVDHGNEASGHKRGETPKFHAFNSFFYNNLKNGGVEKVRRWATKAKIGGKDLMKVEWVFMPVNVGENHWTLIAVSPIRKTIEYYDSFHGSVANRFRDIRAWLKNELGSDYQADEWKTVEDPAMPGMGKGPIQLNGSDCGMHTVTTAKMISLGVDPMAVTRNDMPLQRRRLVAELINGGFTGDFKPNIRFE